MDRSIKYHQQDDLPLVPQGKRTRNTPLQVKNTDQQGKAYMQNSKYFRRVKCSLVDNLYKHFRL
jgi:hypothetical protein